MTESAGRIPRARRGAVAPGEAGFTVVEGLVAALILAIVLIGILPMITRSMQNNLQGNDATNEANAVTDATESLYSLPFNSPRLTLLSDTDPPTVDYYLLDGNKWASALGGDQAQYTRTITLQYFAGSDLADDNKLDTPLSFAEDKTRIQIKQLTLDIDKPRTLTGGPYQVVVWKAH